MNDNILVLEVWTVWVCRTCGKRQEPIEDEEWPMCCDHTMKIVPVRKFHVEQEIA